MSNISNLMQAIGTGCYHRSLVHGGSHHINASDTGDGSSQDTDQQSEKLDPDIRPYAMMTRTGYMEFDPMKDRGKLPEIYGRCIGQYMGDSVLLGDINKNEIQVAVHKKTSSKIYFTNGWSRLRGFYNINSGAWITLLYISPLVFHIKIRYIFGMEITYPNRNPPCRLMLEKGFEQPSSTRPIPFFVLPNIFSHMLEKTLTASDIETGTLTLFWKGFCEDALPNEESQITLIDWVGNTWNQCDFKIHNPAHVTCEISGQWRDICKVHRLAKDVIIKFGVTNASNNKIIYFKLSPYLGVRTTLYAPTTSNNYKRIYQSQHFYML